ncbi:MULTISPECIES: DUF2271 domain-containing protein [Flavobacterium]|uniref:DUF2271 domain-containing protein n=2 Tax=Flavobacterium TaxID=237 RepID=A0AA94JNE2_9FLAO|nr:MULTISPECIES: DUF2271 domain-containing protein [Flavobacterium]OXA83869.1 flagellin biosynthesis protein FlgD [Flavobacterium columnare NBRC 100251 = ATCC 23463]AMA49834.1 flagellin biosynthesis protein FlgD [Flavobacterium covae]AND64638.1 flagellin biosynthesis protein FlgD [Flavobacterium covae]MCH4829040.1 DUF2271 domain-containing protein [Flavobacterium columnare]MCH4833816.1 DUF2271 domain-containing protein [Flavobacterium columnare]
MNKNTRYLGLIVFSLFFNSITAQTSKYKCMLQMTNYVGEGAYIVASLINPKGEYEKTLYVMGDDKKWYKDIKEWYKFYSKKNKVDAKTGASVAGGDRSVTVLEIEDSKINTGYKIRFESAVENQKYHITDAEFPLTTETLLNKVEGKGYIRFVKLNKI